MSRELPADWHNRDGYRAIFAAALTGICANPNFFGPIFQGEPRAAAEFAREVVAAAVSLTAAPFGYCDPSEAVLLDLMEGLQEGLMEDVGLTLEDRAAMRSQLDALGQALDEIRALPAEKKASVAVAKQGEATCAGNLPPDTLNTDLPHESKSPDHG